MSVTDVAEQEAATGARTERIVNDFAIQVATVNGRTQVAIPYWGTNKIAKLELRTKEELAKLQVEVRGTANRR